LVGRRPAPTEYKVSLACSEDVTAIASPSFGRYILGRGRDEGMVECKDEGTVDSRDERTVEGKDMGRQRGRDGSMEEARDAKAIRKMLALHSFGKSKGLGVSIRA